MKKTLPNTGSLMTQDDLAARWQVTKMTLLRRRSAGLLPFVKLGRGVRFRLADVIAIEEKNTIG